MLSKQFFSKKQPVAEKTTDTFGNPQEADGQGDTALSSTVTSADTGTQTASGSQPEAIDDFGEKLGGAKRKTTWNLSMLI